MNEQELKELALQLHKEQIQNIPGSQQTQRMLNPTLGLMEILTYTCTTIIYLLME